MNNEEHLPVDYTMLELSKLTGATTSKIRELIESGKIDAVKRMRGFRVPANQLDKLKELLLLDDKNDDKNNINVEPPDTMLGIPNSDIFAFLMKMIASVREDQSNPQYGQFSVKSDREVLLDLMKSARIEIMPVGQKLGLTKGTDVYNLARSIIIGSASTLIELSNRSDNQIDPEKVEKATQSVLRLLL